MAAATPQTQTVIVHQAASGYFAQRLQQHLSHLGDIPLIETERKTFGDGERYYRVGVDDNAVLVGKTVVFAGALTNDEEYMEAYRVGCALVGYGAQRIIYAVPFLGYSTMERAVKAGEVVTAKANLRMLSMVPSPANVFMLLDLHTSALLHYFEGPSLRMELHAAGVLREAIAGLGLSEEFVVASADLGCTKVVSKLAQHFHAGIAFVRKSRTFENTEVHEVIGDVQGKDVVIYDDMTRSGGTLCQAASAYRRNGAQRVFAVLSHLALNHEGIVDVLEQSDIELVLSTNSHPFSMTPRVQESDKIRIVDVSGVFAERIATLV